MMDLLETIAALKPGDKPRNIRCPAHEDNRASLTVSPGDNGQRIVMHCHAGCKTDDILEAAGLEWADVCNDHYWESVSPAKSNRKKIVATYDYTDEAGTLLYQTVRYEPKDFRQRRPDGNGGWVWKEALKDVRRVLFRLPELLASDVNEPVFLSESGKDVDNLRSLGLIATCHPGGAGTWKADYNDFLVDRDVILLPHNDDGGLKHAAKVQSSLKNIARSIRVVNLPGVPDNGGDVSDWLDLGHTKDELIELVEAKNDRPVLVNLSTVQPENIEWLWLNRLALGTVVAIAGEQGLGKSSVSLDWASRISTGSSWPDNQTSWQKRGSTLIISCEDMVAKTMVPRLDAMRADRNKIHLLDCVQRNGKKEFLDLSRDIDLFDKALQTVQDCRLVIIDPITAYLGATDSHKNAEVRSILDPLAKLAEKYNVCIAMITHLNKGMGLNPDFRVLGSVAFVAVARAVWHVCRDKDPKSNRRLFLPGKNNLADTTGAGLAFTFDGQAVEWEPDAIFDNAFSFYHQQTEAKSAPAKFEAKQFLTEMLKDGPRWAKDLEDEAKENGINWRTVVRSKDELDIVSDKSGFQAKPYWRYAWHEKKPPNE